MAKEIKILVGTCEGRHEMPVSEFIFSQEVNPLAVESLELTATERLEVMAKEAGAEKGILNVPASYAVYSYPEDVDVCESVYDAEIRIYATGLTVAVIAAIKAAVRLFKKVVVLHFNRESGEYYEQKVK